MPHEEMNSSVDDEEEDACWPALVTNADGAKALHDVPIAAKEATPAAMPT